MHSRYLSHQTLSYLASVLEQDWESGWYLVCHRMHLSYPSLHSLSYLDLDLDLVLGSGSVLGLVLVCHQTHLSYLSPHNLNYLDLV